MGSIPRSGIGVLIHFFFRLWDLFGAALHDKFDHLGLLVIFPFFFSSFSTFQWDLSRIRIDYGNFSAQFSNIRSRWRM